MKRLLLRTRFKSLSLIVMAVVLTFTMLPKSAFAIDQQFYSSNDILFYNPDGTCTTNGSPTAVSVKLEKNDTLQQIFQLLINGGMNAGQAAAVMGNMYAESSFNSDRHETGNDIGYGLAQWSFGRRVDLENFAKQKGVPTSDISMQIEFLLGEYNDSYKSLLSSTAFADGTDIAASTKAWMVIFENPAMKPANDPAALNSKRIPAADTIYGFYKDLSPNSPVTTSGCNATGNGAIAGDMVKTALNFALTSPVADGKTAKSDARDTYQSAKEQYNPGPIPDWSDCGGFIATVMIASGVDPNYPKVGVSSQLNYIRSHPEKYKVIEKPTAADLQPGDILLSEQASHTTMYTGQQQYPDVDASLGQRVPSVRDSGNHTWMLSNGAVIARVIK